MQTLQTHIRLLLYCMLRNFCHISWDIHSISTFYFMQARQLVAEHNLISVILHTFLEACEEKKSEFELFLCQIF